MNNAEFFVENARHGDIKWIHQLETAVYSGIDVIPERVLEEWFEANPSGFYIVRNLTGEPVGHIDLLPVRPQVLKKFLNGQIIEKELCGRDLYSPAERNTIEDIYVESLALLLPLRKRAAALKVLSGCLGHLIENVADRNAVKNLYAIAASVQGETIMKKLGFNNISSGTERKDGHKLFTAEAARFLSNKMMNN